VGSLEIFEQLGLDSPELLAEDRVLGADIELPLLKAVGFDRMGRLGQQVFKLSIGIQQDRRGMGRGGKVMGAEPNFEEVSEILHKK